MGRLVISYRREETSGHSGRLYERLIEELGADQVFMDIDAIRPGEDFVEVIEKALSDANVLLALIGPGWTTAKDDHGNRRLDSALDFVRLEIATALKRNIRVIPVLVGGAKMPPQEELPNDIAGLTRRHAVEISDTRWSFDVGRLTDFLRGFLGLEPGEKVEPPLVAEEIEGTRSRDAVVTNSRITELEEKLRASDSRRQQAESVAEARDQQIAELTDIITSERQRVAD